LSVDGETGNAGEGSGTAEDAMRLHFAVARLMDDYISCIDEDRLEEWPDFFTADCRYEIKPRENEAAGLPIALLLCDNRGMLADRVTALRHANIYQPHVYRHFWSGLVIGAVDAATIACSANYMVLQTLQDGETRVFQTGRYYDLIERGPRLRYRSRLAVYDTSRVQTLLVRPV
jgi:anthranilate 1,2-dioxygenase small subunit